MLYFAIFIWIVTVVSTVYALRRVKSTSMWRGPALPTEEEPDLPSEFRMERLRVMGGSLVCMYLTREPCPQKRWIVYCHGMMTNCEAEMAHLLRLNENFNVLAWDYRGFGRSTGIADETVSMYDLHYVLAWLHTQRGFSAEVDARDDVILMGRSLGSNIVLSYVDERNVTPHRLILCHPFISLSGVFSQRGVPSALAYFVGAMDVRGILKKFIDGDKRHRALVLASSYDEVTCWQSAKEECDLANNWRVELCDIGGGHFSIPAEVYPKIKIYGGVVQRRAANEDARDDDDSDSPIEKVPHYPVFAP